MATQPDPPPDRVEPAAPPESPPLPDDPAPAAPPSETPPLSPDIDLPDTGAPEFSPDPGPELP